MTVDPTLVPQRFDWTRTYLWEGLTEADQGGVAQIAPDHVTKTLVAQGVFAGGQYSLECSVDGEVFVPAVDAQGDPIAMTAAGSLVVGSNVPYYQIKNDGQGTDEDVDVFLVAVWKS